MASPNFSDKWLPKLSAASFIVFGGLPPASVEEVVQPQDGRGALVPKTTVLTSFIVGSPFLEMGVIKFYLTISMSGLMIMSLLTDSAIVEYFLAISSILFTMSSELPRTFIRGCKRTFLNQEVLSMYSSTSPS